jgi:hypothetical protein
MAIETKITTVTGMKNYVLRKLGYPLNNIEITEDQLDDAIWDSVQEFQRYNYDEGTYRDYFLLQTSAGQQDYYVSAVRDYTTSATLDNVQNIWDFSISFGLDGINTLFSPTHVLLYNQYVEQGMYPGGPGSDGGMVLTNYQTAMNYIDMINQMFGKNYSVDFLSSREVIRITPTPNQALVGVLILFRKEYAYNLYNNPLVKKLSVAKAGIRWMLNLSKYQGSLPDGLTINSGELLQYYRDEEEKALTAFFEESEPPDFQVL